MHETRKPKARPAFGRRALAAYWLVKAAVELDRRGVRHLFSDCCDLPGSDAAKWTERIHRRWQKSMSVEGLLSMLRRELEILL